jgi:hypothetical protein
MSKARSFTKRLGDFVKEYGWLGTVLAALGAGIWGVVTYLENAKLEYLKEYNSKQTATFFAVSETVSSLVAEDDLGKWNQQNKAFWNLHYGDLVLFESPGIECAMTYFGAKLNTINFEKRQELGPYAFAVSAELRKFIKQLNQENWKIDLAELTGLKGDIAPLLGLKGERLTGSFNPEIQNKIDEKCRKFIVPPSVAVSPS